MTFGEKLAKLVPAGRRSEIARTAGLPPNAISDYINKQYLPRIDIALALSKVLGVPLDWLANDEMDELPKPGEKPGIGAVSDDDLMDEVARRYRLQALRCKAVVELIQKVKWDEFARQVFSLPQGAKLSAELEKSREALWFAAMMIDFSKTMYDPKIRANLLAGRYPTDGDTEIDINAIAERSANLLNANPYARVVLHSLFAGSPNASEILKKHAEAAFEQGKREFEKLEKSQKKPSAGK